MAVRVIAKSFLVAWLVVALAWLPAARAENPAPDSDQSARLTDFLHSHRLPLVGAQVMNSPGGARQSVLLYGYTATELGKSNAEQRTRLFLKDSEVPITNRIRVRPELASMHSPSAALPPASGARPESAGIPPESGAMGGVDSYQNQQANEAQQQYLNQQGQQYMNQQNSTASWANTLIPLIGLGLAIGLGGSGSGLGLGVSPGVGSYGNPYGSYGNPYGGYGGAGNPYGYSNPYAPSPYAPSPYGVPGTGNPYP